MMEIRQDVLQKVRACVAESLAIEPERIAEGSRLIDDLGANSLDFIDIVFMLERDLGIRVRDTELNFLTRLDFSSPEEMTEGFLTRPVVDRLVEWLPALRAVPHRDQVSPRQLFSLITVESICLVAQMNLEANLDSKQVAVG